MLKVILNEDITELGRMGDVINVKDGFARNYLIPKKLAIPASERNVKMVQKKREKMKEELEAKRQEAVQLKDKIEALSLTIQMNAGEDDKLFGSVTTEMIAKACENEGYKIERKNIHISEQIKTLGVFNVPVKLHPDVTATLKVWVVKS